MFLKPLKEYNHTNYWVIELAKGSFISYVHKIFRVRMCEYYKVENVKFSAKFNACAKS